MQRALHRRHGLIPTFHSHQKGELALPFFDASKPKPSPHLNHAIHGGPAGLKLSAWCARDLAERNYHFTVQINWIGIPNESEVAQIMDDAVAEMRNKKVANACPYDLSKKFWAYLLGRAGIGVDAVWHELGKKAKNKLVNTLLNDIYDVRGKTTFKEEFVTCGGVALGEVDFSTMESRIVPGLHFAGEVLDVDGVTGGFNFQAAWTTGFVAGRSLSY